MVIGVDFDNTIVCYDGIFHKVAFERRLIPADLPISKGAVRDFLRKAEREDSWTELQGYVYGARMNEAAPYPGAIDFFRRCRLDEQKVLIISHKTRFPYLGDKHDLHEAAYRWLELQGFFGPSIGLTRHDVFFDLTKSEKLARIVRARCTHFIDDLPEFLGEQDFPSSVSKILFDPVGNSTSGGGWLRVSSWMEIMKLFFGDS
jgi:hypothetical protein